MKRAASGQARTQERPAPAHTHNLSPLDRLALFVEYVANKRLRGLGAVVYRLTGGPRGRDALLLTTRGRKSGRQHTVLLQGFRDGTSMLVVAANSGRQTDPDWFYNLKASPTARIEMAGHTQHVRAEQLSDEEARAFWPRVLQRAPSYTRYLEATDRAIPLVRLVPIALAEKAPPASPPQEKIASELRD
jgi:deazaflavin-dependent oxidoreductase (nitroreductase family)